MKNTDSHHLSENFFNVAMLSVTIHALPGKPYEMTEGVLAGQSTQKSIKMTKNYIPSRYALCVRANKIALCGNA